MRTKRPVKSIAVTSLADAFASTDAGKALLLQAKTEKDMRFQRVRTLKQRVHDTFVKVPRGKSVRFDVYQASKAHCKAVALKGGDAYEETLESLKWVWTGKAEYRKAIELCTGK